MTAATPLHQHPDDLPRRGRGRARLAPPGLGRRVMDHAERFGGAWLVGAAASSVAVVATVLRPVLG